jgi:predicted site-specific integrase-resolvase
MVTRLPSHSGDQLLRPHEVARIFGIGPSTLGRWARGGRLAWTLTPGGHRRYRWADVRKLIGTNGSVADGSR